MKNEYFHHKKNRIIGVIPIRHSSEELLTMLNNKEWYSPVLQHKSESRKAEWLTVRYLLYLLLGEEKEIIYTSTGKPELADQSYRISISHTKGYIAIVLNKNKEVGIDIEYLSPRVKKITERFLNEKEKEHISGKEEVIHLLLHWSAKETLFKAIGCNDIDFKSEIYIKPFSPQLEQWSQMEACETRSSHNNHFLIDYLVTKDYVLTVTNLT